MQITSQEIRQKYLDFFLSKNHAIIPSAWVVPENDPTVLFNTAWMQPLVPYLLWEKHPFWKRLANFQKCIRTSDIDEIWDDTHLTFFEMLWNWSLWDYFKNESIKFSYEFLTSKDWLGINPKKIAVTVFEWDQNAPKDEESANIWKSLWITNISYLWKKDNWWGPAWATWPCWPDTEIFYWVWCDNFPPKESTVKNDEKNWMEIWNNVFMEYIKDENWNYNKATIQNVDTWMGLERITRTLSWASSVYETDIFSDIIEVICKTLNINYDENTKNSIKIIADHTRTAVIMISDWVIPSNVDQGYILRRLLRRAIRQWYKLNFKWQFLENIAKKIIQKFSSLYTNVLDNKNIILEEINKEEKQFLQTLEKGLKEFEKKIIPPPTGTPFKKGRKEISWKEVFDLFQTYGFPIEITVELAQEKWLKVDKKWFYEEFKKHQELSRAWASQKFSGGLADNSKITIALHSATHLLLAWLRKYLWNDVYQAGSNITQERLRFDFSYPEKVEKEILDKVENYVNEIINKNTKVILQEMTKKQAKNLWVVWSFWDKYPDIVKVYTFSWDDWTIYSRELCWGPHVNDTENMWKFKILKEEASSRGIRRIKAILEK